MIHGLYLLNDLISEREKIISNAEKYVDIYKNNPQLRSIYNGSAELNKQVCRELEMVRDMLFVDIGKLQEENEHLKNMLQAHTKDKK